MKICCIANQSRRPVRTQWFGTRSPESLRHYLLVTSLLIILASSLAQAGELPEKNPVIEKIRAGNPVFGGFVTIPSAKVIENLAVPGKLDFIWIEAEHSEFGPRETQDLTVAAENEGLVPMVRVPSGDVNLIKKYVGTGVLGVIVPNVRNASEATLAVAALKYPPRGNRPAGVERGNRYLGRFKDYKARANDLVMVILMIENKEAVADISAILQVPGIDILHVGPYDLSLSMGVSMDSPEFESTLTKIETAARLAGKPLGCALPDAAKLSEKMAAGYRFFTIPGDMEMLQQSVSRYFSGTQLPSK